MYCIPGSKINFWPHLPKAGELKRKNLTDIDNNIYISYASLAKSYTVAPKCI